MRARAGNKLKKLLGGVLTLSMLLSGLYVSPVAAEGPEEAQGDPQPIAESVSDNDPVRAMSLDSGIMPIADGAGVYVLDVRDGTLGVAAFGAGEKGNGEEEKAGTDSYFTLVYSAKTKVENRSDAKSFEDG